MSLRAPPPRADGICALLRNVPYPQLAHQAEPIHFPRACADSEVDTALPVNISVKDDPEDSQFTWAAVIGFGRGPTASMLQKLLSPAIRLVLDLDGHAPLTL